MRASPRADNLLSTPAYGLVKHTNAPSTTISGSLGTVTVTDNRALLSAAWTVVASSSDWTTGGGMLAETIPAGDVGYTPGVITPTGTITLTTSRK